MSGVSPKPSKDGELAAELLRPGDRIKCQGEEWLVAGVAVSTIDPVVVIARRLVDGKPTGEPRSLDLMRLELVRVRE